MKFKTILILLLLILTTQSAFLKPLSCNVSSSENEVLANSTVEITIEYFNFEKEFEAIINCGNGNEKNAACTYDTQSQSAVCKTQCTYEKQGIYSANAQVAASQCGSVKIEVLDASEQNFEENNFLEFMQDSNQAQVNILKITSVPAIINYKTQVVNLTTRQRLPLKSVKCTPTNNQANCTCEVIRSENTRAQVTCTFQQPLKEDYQITFTTRDSHEKTFAVSLKKGQATAIFPPRASLNLTIIAGVVMVIVTIALITRAALKKLDDQTKTQ